MSKGTPRRSIRVEGGLWQAAQEKAADRGDNISEVIRQALTDYIKQWGKK